MYRPRLLWIVFAPMVLVACGRGDAPSLSVIPTPSTVEVRDGSVSLAEGVSLAGGGPDLDGLFEVFEQDYLLLTGLRNDQTEGRVTLRLAVDDAIPTDEYRLSVDDEVVVYGGSRQAVSMGLVTLLQAADRRMVVPRMEVVDRPAMPYRGVMLDLARAWHDVGTIKEIIDLCRWYKVNVLHLHLTDDQSFTFPSTSFPALATVERSYSLTDLQELNDYASARGVVLVPEIDVPGHATQLVEKMPGLFGIGDPGLNPFTITMGREQTYRALDTLIGEVAEAFPHSPYVHIGGDEAFWAGMAEDPETVAYMGSRGLATLDGLFGHFLARLDTMVRARGRRTVVWAGFKRDAEVEVPRDVVVMSWEAQYYDPQHLIDDGYQVINASFKPLYVVNNRKWAPDYILTQWNPRRWESWATGGETFQGAEVRPTDWILGASMSAWEQDQTNQLSRLRRRVPAMIERLWREEAPDTDDFHRRLSATDGTLNRLLRPFDVREEGWTEPDAGEGLFLEHRWFATSVRIEARPSFGEIVLRYSLGGEPVHADADILPDVLTLRESTTVTIQAFDLAGLEVGHPYHQRYVLMPIAVEESGLWKELPVGSWEKHRFEGRMTVALGVARPDLEIAVTLDGGRPTAEAPRYDGPITIDRTTTLRAQAVDGAGEAVGEAFGQTYFEIRAQPSLTTGKPTTASNETGRPGLSGLATNGRVTLWEQWGGNVGDHVWVAVDMERPETITRLQIQNFWDGRRYYQYTIDGSLDGETWTEIVDFRQNTIPATIDGYVHTIDATVVRHLRINLLYNSANPGLHLVEFSAFR